MDEDIVGFPKEADNTAFTAQSDMNVSELRETLQEFFDRESIGMPTAMELVFFIENEHYCGRLRLFLSGDHVTKDFERFPELFNIGGDAVLLDADDEELATPLAVTGQFDFSFIGESDAQLGTLTVWRREDNPYRELLDAS